MSGPKNIRCRNFNDEGFGECDSGEYCRFVHPGPRWANARSYHNRDDFDHLPKFWGGGGGGGGSGGGRGRPVGGGGGGKGPIPKRCRYYESDGTPIKNGCFRYPKGECRFTHPDQPGWNTSAPSENSFSQTNSSFGLTGSNSLPVRGDSSFGRTSTDATADGSGFGFGTGVIHHSPEPADASSGWGQSNSNEPGQSANESSSGGGWGNTSHGWGTSQTNNTNTGWGKGDNSSGGWGNGDKGSGGWGAGDNTGGGWGSGDNTGGGWGNSGGGWGGGENSGGGWGGGDSSGGGWGNEDNDGGGGWGSTVSGSGGGGWGSSSRNNDSAATTQPTAQSQATDTTPLVPTSTDKAWGSSNNTWGSSNDTWGSSNNTQRASGWGSANNTWGASNETAPNETTNETIPDKGKGKGWESNVQDGGWSSWRDTSNSETVTGSNSAGGGWGNPAPPAPATVSVTQNYTHATARSDTSPATMNVDVGEPQFEGKGILNALENAVHRRRNKRKRSLEDITQSPRYNRHLFAAGCNARSTVGGDDDAIMDETMKKCAPEGSVEPGEISETPPCIDYDMKVLSHEPKTSDEKTLFAKHLLYIFTEAAVMVDRSRISEKRYEDYKKLQEARRYNHPGPDARAVLVEKLQAIRASSYEQSERLARVISDLGSLPSHYVSDVVAYNEHNHLAEDALAEERRKAAIEELEKRLAEQHDCVDRKLLGLQVRLNDLAKEKEAREILLNLPPPVDPREVAVEEAAVAHKANVQRVAAVEDALQTITSAESNPHKDGPIATLEKSLPNADSHALQLQEFAESIAKLIHQIPVVRGEIEAIKADNEERKGVEKTRQKKMETLDQQVLTSSAQLEALHTQVTELNEGLRRQVTMENVHAAVRPVLREQTHVVMADVHECVDRGLDAMRRLIQAERTRMRSHIYDRLVGTQRLFEAVGCYLRSVRADLASLVDKDRGTTGPS